jgi:ribosomal protein L24E
MPLILNKPTQTAEGLDVQAGAFIELASQTFLTYNSENDNFGTRIEVSGYSYINTNAYKQGKSKVNLQNITPSIGFDYVSEDGNVIYVAHQKVKEKILADNPTWVDADVTIVLS